MIRVTKVWVVLVFMAAVQIAVKIATLVEHKMRIFLRCI